MKLIKEKWLEILCGIAVGVVLIYAAIHAKETKEFLKCFEVGC